tara:strand:+ start:71 stop:229 length:159 start_codon:yes stop_codon:yes gene_type:complete
MDAEKVQVAEETSEGLNDTTKEVLMMNTFGAWFVGITVVLVMIAVLRAISGV